MMSYGRGAKLALLLAPILLAGCGGGSSVRSAGPASYGPAPVTQPLSAADYLLREALYDEFAFWQGTPYRYGGMNRQGLDCSAFVLLVFQNILGVPLPRVTEEQARVGESVQRAHWLPGDLIFFRTSRSSRHVGIYLEAGRFMHASRSKGVIISSVQNPYWAGHYWLTRRLPAGWRQRVLPPQAFTP